jgi:hypothetical protein
MLVRQLEGNSLPSECIDLTARGRCFNSKRKSREDAEDESVSMRLKFKFRYFTGSAFIRFLDEIRLMGLGGVPRTHPKGSVPRHLQFPSLSVPPKEQKNRTWRRVCLEAKPNSAVKQQAPLGIATSFNFEFNEAELWYIQWHR